MSVENVRRASPSGINEAEEQSGAFPPAPSNSQSILLHPTPADPPATLKPRVPELGGSHSAHEYPPQPPRPDFSSRSTHNPNHAPNPQSPSEYSPIYDQYTFKCAPQPPISNTYQKTSPWDAHTRTRDIERKEFIKSVISKLRALYAFAGLVSALITFDTYGLQPDPHEQKIRILCHLLKAFADVEPPTPTIVAEKCSATTPEMNDYFLASLCCFLFTFLGFVHAEMFLFENDQDGGELLNLLAELSQEFQPKYSSQDKWALRNLVVILPMSLKLPLLPLISLLLILAGFGNPINEAVTRIAIHRTIDILIFKVTFQVGGIIYIQLRRGYLAMPVIHPIPSLIESWFTYRINELCKWWRDQRMGPDLKTARSTKVIGPASIHQGETQLKSRTTPPTPQSTPLPCSPHNGTPTDWLVQSLQPTRFNQSEGTYLTLSPDEIHLVEPYGAFPAPSSGSCNLLIGMHTLNRTKVALKSPRCTTENEENILRRSKREAKIWSQLNHPNILPFLGIIDNDPQFYLVSPLLPRGDLLSFVQIRSKISSQSDDPSVLAHDLGPYLAFSELRTMQDIATGLGYMHKLGMVHGDLKARNVLLADDGHALICDFGLTKGLDNAITSVELKGGGSVRWQSPELFNNESKTSKSDVYAFGMTIAEVLTGDIPFPHLNLLAVLRAVLLEDKRPPFDPVSFLGVDYMPLWNVAANCWATHSADRPTMEEVLRELEPISG